MTLNAYIDKISTFRDKSKTGDMEVVFHDVDGAAFFFFDICQDGTCCDDDVVRITLLEDEESK